MVARRIFRNGRSSFRFDCTKVVTVKDPTPDELLTAVREKSIGIHYEPLDGMQIDHTGLVERNGARFSHYGFSRLCNALDVPIRFINALSKERATLAADIINTRIKTRGQNLQVAMDSGVIEGVVSDKYSRLENTKVAETVIDASDGKFNKLQLEGLRMRITRIGDREYDVSPKKVGDFVKGGIDVYNGEDGGASFNVSAYIYRLVCSNGLIMPRETSIGKLIHKGSGLREKAAFIIYNSRELCNQFIERLSKASEIILTNIEQRELATLMRNTYSMSFANNVLDKAQEEAKTEGNDRISLYNVVNGITFQAHNTDSLDKSRSIETFASRVLNDGVKLAA